MLKRIGYVVVVPERRGYGKSDGQTFGEAVGEDRGPRFVARVQEETDDVLAAVEFVKTLPYADTARLGVMGWSFGGITSVFAASRSSAFRVVVDQAGAALTWERSPAMQGALKEAAGKIRVPLLGMVAKNDRTTESVKAVVREAEKHGAAAKLIVYPAFTPREATGIAPGHMIFGKEGWRIWEADLKEFLGKYLAGTKE
jgi:dienelactone hydrolase